MSRLSPLLLLIALSPLLSAQQSGLSDPAFEKIPFNQWLAEPNAAHLRWTVNISHPVLSFHQRLLSEIAIEVDGKDLNARRGGGQLVTFFQLTSQEGTRYQGHSSVDLNKLDPDIKAASVQSVQQAFLLPGEYHLAVALLYTRSGEHATYQTRFRVPAPSSKLLVESWRHLPSVEFLTAREAPENWYLPEIQGQCEWAVNLQAPASLQVILNVAPSASAVGTRRTPSNGLPALLPTLKLFSQSGSPQLSEHIELLDLARRHAVLQSDGTLDWPSLKSALASADTASIDLHSLADRHQDAQFFLTQVRRLLRSPPKAASKTKVLVILTTPLAFESGEDLTPISLEDLPPSRVFYIRYHATPQRTVNPYPGRGRGVRMGGPMRPMQVNLVDQLEATLKPLNPKLFDVETPEEITRALSEILKVL